MSLFRKPKKSIQRRVFTENDDPDDDEGTTMEVEIPTILKDQKKKDKTKGAPKKQSLLSFETEEEGEVFQEKKSSHSKRRMRLYEKDRQKKREPKPEPEKEVVKTKEPVTQIITDDLIMKVNSSHKVPSPPQPILSGRAALCAGRDDMSSDEDDQPVHRFSKPDSVKIVLESGVIPDAAMIHAARKRRQKARELGGEFVPLEDEESEDPGGGRLRHQDDQDDGSDEERIDMDANPLVRDKERRREQFLAAQESDLDDDMELDEWENQQIRKGVTGVVAANIQSELANAYEEYETRPKITSTPTIDLNEQRTPEAMAAKLREKFEELVALRDTRTQQLKQVQDDLIRIEVGELEKLKTKAPKAAERFRFYQELRGYITDLVECLDEKVGTISDLEQRALNLMANKAEWLIERRRQDVRDQADEVTSASKGMAIRRGLDDEEKVRRAAEREGRRTRRRRVREQQGQPKHVEGMSSDDEIMQQDSMNFDKEREQLEQEVQKVFEDVVDEYSSIANILIRFEQWRETDIGSYQDAYAPLGLPRAVAPLLRLQLIFWDPLTESVEIEKIDWYRTLALYGLHDDETESDLTQDPDINLLPTIIEKIIIPKLDKLVDRCWDPLSTSQTLRLVGVLSRYIRRFPTLGPASKSLQNLFNAVLHKLKGALENDVFIPITLKTSESKSSFFQRQFACGLKLLRNITCWQGILNDNTLKDLALNALLNRYLLNAIRVCQVTDAVSKVGLISHILPRVWLQGNISQLQMFNICVTNLAKQLDKENPLHLESIDILTSVLKSLRNV